MSWASPRICTCIAGAQIFLLLLAAVALAELWCFLAGRWRCVAAVAATAALLYPMIAERVSVVSRNRFFGNANLQAHATERPQVDAVLAEVRRQGGRAYAGLSSGWGAGFKVGYVPMYGVFSAAAVPAVG